MTKIALGNGWELRPWQPSDIHALAKYANNRNIWRNLRNGFPHPYTLEDARTYTERVTVESPVTSFAIASASEAAGGISIQRQGDVARRSAEIGYWLGEPFWGKGIATKATLAIVEYAFARFDLVRRHAGVFEWNPASARVLEKAGFTLESRERKSVTKDGQTIDAFVYALIRDEGLEDR